MSENRTKNSSRNLVWGILNKIITLILPFITRTVTLYLLGANYLGVGTLFSSVLSFLSLTELGLSSAIVYTMYKPIAQGDRERAGALLNLYRKLYRIVGIVMLIIGTALLPFIPYLIKSGAPDQINIYVLYYIYLVNSVISYFFAGYRSCLLSAHQREDISTKISTLISIFVQFGQVFALLATKNFYVYAFVPVCGTLITNAAYAIATRKMFPDIVPSGTVDRETANGIRRKLSGLVGTKLNSIVVHSADTVVISAFLGLTITAQYGNYYLIFNAVCNFVAVFFTSITASIGNKLVTDTIENNYVLFKRLSFLNTWIVCWCCTCFLCLFEPFMYVWVGEELSLGLPFTILMVVYFFIYQIQKTILTFKDAAGLWQEDRLRPYISMIINVVSNIILVQFIGIYGIVLSTIIAFLISVPWANKVLFDHLFKKNHFLNLAVLGRDFLITAFICVASFAACSICRQGLLGVIERFAICCVLPNIFMAILFMNNKEFAYWKHFVGNTVIKKLKRG